MLTTLTRRSIAGLLGAAVTATLARAADIQPSTPQPPTLNKVRAAIKVRNYDAALADLRTMEATTKTADVYNLMGFCLRKKGERPQAMTYYNKALDLDPNHKGALEYQGELFVELGQLPQAKANLAKLAKLCPGGCEEREDLEAAIAKADKRA